MHIALSTTEVLDFEYLTLCFSARTACWFLLTLTFFCWYALFCHFDTVLCFWNASQLIAHSLQLNIYIFV
jgi:hypothetical protein